jgi:hypothetical protein
MKSKIYILLLMLSLIFISCSNDWNNYYGANNGEEYLDETFKEFFASHSEYSEFYQQLKDCGLDTLLTRNQELTVWAVDNDGMANAELGKNDTTRMKYHINHLAYTQSELKNGLRIQSLNGIYFQITKKSSDSLYVNSSKVEESFRLKNGVVHHISSLMKSRINLYDYIRTLGNDYSIIRDSLMKDCKRVFDKANSTPVSVDKTGNTVYDSVFYVYHPYFATVDFSSEFSQITFLLPSNNVINKCFSDLNESFVSMGKGQLTKSDTITAMTWIKKAMFFNSELTASSFNTKDLYSAFTEQWRTTVQDVDVNDPVEMSNGRMYYVTKLHVPNNVMISRIKSLLYYWEYLQTDEEKFGTVYKFKGTPDDTNQASYVSVFTDSSTPKTSIMPYYYTLNVTGNADSNDEFSAEFHPLSLDTLATGSIVASVMEVPTGEYTLYMGFHSSGHPYINVYFNDEKVNSTPLEIDLSNPWNFDRVNQTEADRITGGTAKWDGLGGPVGVVNVTSSDGSGMATFRIKVQFAKLSSEGATKSLRMYHWALVPTSNNY